MYNEGKKERKGLKEREIDGQRERERERERDAICQFFPLITKFSMRCITTRYQ